MPQSIPSIILRSTFRCWTTPKDSSTFGLHVQRSDREPQLSAGDGHRWGRILGGKPKSLAYIAFNCFEEDLQAIETQAREAGATFEVLSPFKTGVGLWFTDPDGNLVQVKAGPRTMPDSKPSFEVAHAQADARGALSRSLAAQVRPRRLSHALFFTPSVPAAVEFYERALGLRLSDKSLDIIAFMHAPHGCDHHLLAFAKSTARGWHHCAWDVPALDDVGVGASRMQAAGYRNGWGTGRHRLPVGGPRLADRRLSA
jgi:catechol 2,3-dioxygenase